MGLSGKIREVWRIGGIELGSRSARSSAVTESNDGRVRSLNDSLEGEAPLLIQVATQWSEP